MKRILFFLILLGCTNRDYRINKAREFMQSWNYERALVELNPFKDKRDAMAHYLIGQCYLGKNNYEEARNYFKEAIQFDTIYIDSVDPVYKSLIQKSMKIEDTERAAFFFDQLLSLSPRPFFEPSFLFLMGDIYYNSKNYEKAAATYEKGMGLDSTSSAAKEVLTRLIESYEKSNNLRKALPLVEARYQKTKSSLFLVRLGKYYFDIALSSFEERSIDTARLYFEKVIESNTPQSMVDDAYFYLGEISFKLGNLSDAQTFYEKVIRLNPYRKGVVFEKAKARLEEIKGREGK